MIRLSVGITKKVVEANYGSRGASCGVEAEVDGLLVDRPEELKDRVRRLHAMARAVVDEELARNEAGTNGTTPSSSGQVNGNGANGHRASTKQLDYAQQLVGQTRGLGVRRPETFTQKMFDKPLANLTSLDASGLINALRDI